MSLGPAEIGNVTYRVDCSNVRPAYQADNGTGAVAFGGYSYLYNLSNEQPQWVQFTNVTPSLNGWNLTAKSGGVHMVNITGANKLAPGMFLICGDRAWTSVPWRPVGGPCYLGKLTIFAPSKSQMIGKFNRTRVKRELFTKDCDDNVMLPSRTESIFASFLSQEQ